MASKKVNIQIDTRANTSGAKQAEQAIDAVSSASRQAETASAAAAAASTKQAAGTSRVGQVASQAGFQVQDFAVQVAGGTSALTAMAQQAPQFLGVFGPGGAIAGALIAVGAVATKVFMSMQDGAADTITSAETLSDAIEQIGENAKKAVAKEVDFGLKQIETAKTSATNLIGVFDGVRDAANAAALASLTNAEKLREAEIEIRKLRGEQVDEMGNIIANAQAEAALRQQIAQQEIDAQAEKEAQAKEALSIAQEALDQTNAMKSAKEAELSIEEKRLEQLREQRDILKEIAEKGYFEVTAQDVATLGMAPGTTSGQARNEARRRLEKDIAPQIGKTEGDIEGLEEQLKVLATQASTSVDEIKMLTAQVAAIVQEVAIAIPEIATAYQTADIVAQVGTIREVAEQAATEVQSVIDTVKPANAAEAAALEALKPMVADKQITADETLRVSQLLRTLDGAIRTQMGTAAANTQKLIDTISTMQRTLDAQSKQIQRLQSQARSSGN